jgi:IPT/TIG domain
MKIASMDPTSGPVGTTVTIVGDGFGEAQVSSTLAMNGMPVTPKSWNDASIVVRVPQGATDGPVSVQVGAQELSAGRFKVTTEPLVFNISAQLRAIANDLESRHL